MGVVVAGVVRLFVWLGEWVVLWGFLFVCSFASFVVFSFFVLFLFYLIRIKLFSSIYSACFRFFCQLLFFQATDLYLFTCSRNRHPLLDIIGALCEDNERPQLDGNNKKHKERTKERRKKERKEGRKKEGT